MVSSAAGALSIALIALWARRLLGGEAFFPTVCVLLGSSTLLLHSSMTRVYSLQLATFSAVLLCVSTYQPQTPLGLAIRLPIGTRGHDPYLIFRSPDLRLDYALEQSKGMARPRALDFGGFVFRCLPLFVDSLARPLMAGGLVGKAFKL
jgi:hypothetical protein